MYIQFLFSRACRCIWLCHHIAPLCHTWWIMQVLPPSHIQKSQELLTIFRSVHYISTTSVVESVLCLNDSSVIPRGMPLEGMARNYWDQLEMPPRRRINCYLCPVAIRFWRGLLSSQFTYDRQILQEDVEREIRNATNYYDPFHVSHRPNTPFRQLSGRSFFAQPSTPLALCATD